MQKLTRVTLSTGEMAIYLDGWYLTSTGDGDHPQGLDDVVTGLLNMPGMRLEYIEAECPAQADWCWNDVAAVVFAGPQPRPGACTVAAFIARLSQYPADGLCCGTFWLQDDFLTLDAELTEEQVGQAMEVAEDSHDADIGFNWEHLRYAINAVKRP